MSIRASRTAAGIILVVIAVAIFWYMKRDTSYIGTASYEECVQSGYPILETFPEQCRTPDGKTFIRIIPDATTTATSTESGGMLSFPADNSDRIRVTDISANQKITSPLVVDGEARGGWYFEASFPVEIFDGNGKLIAQVPAQAIGEWMTSEFVPFSTVITFVKPSTATGTLILRNDNASGLPENDRWISIPIQF